MTGLPLRKKKPVGGYEKPWRNLDPNYEAIIRDKKNNSQLSLKHNQEPLASIGSARASTDMKSQNPIHHPD